MMTPTPSMDAEAMTRLAKMERLPVITAWLDANGIDLAWTCTQRGSAGRSLPATPKALAIVGGAEGPGRAKLRLRGALDGLRPRWRHGDDARTTICRDRSRRCALSGSPGRPLRGTGSPPRLTVCS